MLDWGGAVHVHVTQSLSSTPQAKRDLGNWDKLFVPNADFCKQYIMSALMSSFKLRILNLFHFTFFPLFGTGSELLNKQVMLLWQQPGFSFSNEAAVDLSKAGGD